MLLFVVDNFEMLFVRSDDDEPVKSPSIRVKVGYCSNEICIMPTSQEFQIYVD
jgi:hypothetical protein